MVDCLLYFAALTKKESVGGRKINDKYGHLPPLGLAYLAGALLDAGFSASIIEPLAARLDDDGVLKRIERERPRAVGLSALTPTFAKTVQMARRIRERFPETLILVGGPHITLSCQAGKAGPASGLLEEFSCFDMACVGEGEHTLVELMRHFKALDFDRETLLQGPSELEAIPGLLFRTGKKVGGCFFSGPREPADLNALPLPARHLLPMDRYIPFPVQYRRLPVVHMFVSRGCPWKCSFCCTPFTWGRQVRLRDPGLVVEEVRQVVRDFGAKEISFWDDTFTANPEWLKALCRRMESDAPGILWSCFARANDLSPELARAMKRGGCWEVFLGIESVNQDSLKAIQKGLSPAITRKAVRNCREAGIEVRGLFMLGLPHETPQRAMETIDFAVELDLDYAQFTVTTPHKGTRLYEDAPRFGHMIAEDNSRHTQMEAVFVPSGYENAAQLNELVKTAYKKFYMRPRYWWKKVRSIRSFADLRRYVQGFRIALALIHYKMENWKSDLGEEVAAPLRSH